MCAPSGKRAVVAAEDKVVKTEEQEDKSSRTAQTDRKAENEDHLTDFIVRFSN